jgi:Ca2+-binding EF-hand superfamily protein
VLRKAFKYFDLNDNGTVEPDEFAKAIEKIGIQIPTQQVSHHPLFDLSYRTVR